MTNDLILHDPQPSRADALKNRALLLETAKRLFAEKSVETVTMSDIAKSAGVGKGTLYRHFENKSQLCHALLDQEMRDLQESALRRLQNQGEALEDLSWFLEQVALFVIRNTQMLFVEEPPARAEAEQNQTMPFLSLLGHPAHFWWRQTIRGLLQRINPPGDLDYMADMLYVMLDARTVYFQIRALGYSADRIINGLKSTLALIAR
ncbi:MAG: TetR family transcriptional regulator [Anaerolineae bacterium]|nr:TetR family transcriptional regulator [Anaerolineae bacterium]